MYFWAAKNSYLVSNHMGRAAKSGRVPFDGCDGYYSDKEICMLGKDSGESDSESSTEDDIKTLKKDMKVLLKLVRSQRNKKVEDSEKTKTKGEEESWKAWNGLEMKRKKKIQAKIGKVIKKALKKMGEY